ncbi:hypothetical protein, conserved in T. vivax [Trypanosoma vivax Y486]|uniref:Uncharacterized protein n=1 Tax=Trypanosoma vivax (strain Y486) TaxID=1055687 RepID=F9WTB2_TRYVY|nr:hypothetical protein, conserved in T. vivax [Trypanosoma vivax Y486]|eukprot:CCD20805.1 hypothetical protein, conserved in T. vivax [Trypanosoma vivax Y486]
MTTRRSITSNASSIITLGGANVPLRHNSAATSLPLFFTISTACMKFPPIEFTRTRSKLTALSSSFFSSAILERSASTFLRVASFIFSNVSTSSANCLVFSFASCACFNWSATVDVISFAFDASPNANLLLSKAFLASAPAAVMVLRAVLISLTKSIFFFMANIKEVFSSFIARVTLQYTSLFWTKSSPSSPVTRFSASRSCISDMFNRSITSGTALLYRSSIHCHEVLFTLHLYLSLFSRTWVHIFLIGSSFTVPL